MKKFLVVLLAFVWAFSAVSCSKIELDEEETSQSQSATGSTKVPTTTLRVKFQTSETESGETTISYPVNVYVFDQQGQCVSLKVITSSSSTLSLKLPVGSYDVYAIGGADEAVYELPTQDKATKESLLTLRTGKYNDLMTAKSSVTLNEGETQNLVLQLSRRVMMLQNVVINSVPSEVTAVSVELTSLYQSINLQGDVLGEGSYECVLQKEQGTSTWKNTESIYLLPATVSTMQLKIVFTLPTGEKESFVYNATDQFVANYRINIKATYIPQDGILEGILKGTSWDGEKNIEFTFNGSSGTSGGNTAEDDPTEVVSGDVPTVGSLYNDDYVLSVTDNGTTATVLLLSGKTQKNMIGTEQINNKDYILSQLQSICSSAYTGWRLPTYSEALVIKENAVAINAKMREEQNDNRQVWDCSSSYYLLYEDESGSLSTLNLGNGTTYSGNALTIAYLSHSYMRGVVTVTFNK